MAGAVEVDPGHEPLPRLAIELHIVMALLQHLHELRRAGVKLHGRQDVQIALQAADANEPAQLDVCRIEDAAVRAQELGARDAGDSLELRVAVLVHHEGVCCRRRSGIALPSSRGLPSWHPTQ